MEKSKWIWHPGSFELYHSSLLHNRRTTVKNTEDGKTKSVYYYPMWRVDSPQLNSILEKTVVLEKDEEIEFYSNTETALLEVDKVALNPGERAVIKAGEHKLCLQGYKKDGFPAYYIKGDTIKTDRTWVVGGDDEKKGRHAGYSDYYKDPTDNPEIFKFEYKKCLPVSKKEVDGGTLFDFGKEMFGKVYLDGLSKDEIFVSLGESYEEAVDTKYATIGLNAKGKSYTSPEAVALRYVYVPSVTGCEAYVELEYLPLCELGSFECENELINTIYKTCAYTMLLNTREAFFDGIKRDRWVWSGDAYQSYLVNYYLYNDKDAVRRTIRMLRGRDPIKKHINTICDYTFLWIISIWDYYFYTGDIDFINDIYPEILDMWDFIEPRLDENGMYKRKSDDWVFIDWSTFDESGPISAENMLLARAYESTAKIAKLLSDEKTAKSSLLKFENIKNKVNELYWDEEKGAFVDDYKSGKRNVTRHANIFALLFGYANKEREEKIINNVILSDEVTKITTPYFEFYELDAMCKIGNYKYMTDMLNNYWGEMIRLGATTIWEEFDPTKKGIEHYEMYGGKYEKSLCHAWGASPIYLLGKYALGIAPTSAGYKTYEVVPKDVGIGKFSGTVPTENGNVFVSFDGKTAEVVSEIDGGTLILGDKKYPIKKGERLVAKI